MTRPLITLLTDFGTRDAYVASIKGVILGLNPQVVLVDLTHEIPPQDVRAGAFVLAAAAPYFPPGTINLAVVDPGVGSPRRALAARARGQFWVGPDNGLFHLVLAGQSEVEIVEIKNQAFFLPQVSATFHGRDVLAPVAAHLSLGVGLSRLGPCIADPVWLDFPAPDYGREAARGEIIYVDRFGNLVSNLAAADLKDWAAEQGILIKVGAVEIRGLSSTYAEVAPRQFVSLEGSHGYLEIACNQDSAARRLGAGVGIPIEIFKE